MARFSVLVLNGPSLDRLGTREPEIYGTTTLPQIVATLEANAAREDARVVARQSAHEGALVDWINSAADEGFHGLLINPGAYTHTSVALYDALRATHLPAIEVHLSNPEAREAFRRRSYVARVCVGKVAGFGPRSYELALAGLLDVLRRGA